MAEVRKITIEILNKGSDGGGTGNGTQVNEKKYDKKIVLDDPEEATKQQKKALKALALMAVGQALNLVVQNTTISLNKYFSLSEDYMSESSYKNAVTVVNKTQSFATQVTAGAVAGGKIGMYFGPQGAAIGAAIGGVISAVGWVGTEYNQNQAILSSYYGSINATNTQTEYFKLRAGLVDNGRGTEN